MVRIKYFLLSFAFVVLIVLFSQCEKELSNNKSQVPGSGNKQSTNITPRSFSDFTSIKPADKDQVILPKGFIYQLLISYGDKINLKGDTFGFNNDHIEYFPIDGLKGGSNSKEGYLFISHEYYFSPKSIEEKTTKDIDHEKYLTGGSIIKVRNQQGKWTIDYTDPHNKRLTALSKIKVDGPARSIIGKNVIGTMDNCSGGQTPWGTVLSGEESLTYGLQRKWHNFKPKTIGWIVEIDPYNPKSKPVKHTALGRFKHENAAVKISKTGQVVIYMGDDHNFGAFYKFISKRKYKKGNRKHNLKLLSEGTLYGAQFKNVENEKGHGKWIPIDFNDPKSRVKLKKAGFKSQSEVLLDCHKASRALEISGLDRPEDCEIHPKDGSIYLALTNNMAKASPNLHGMILRIIENDDNSLSMAFSYETFLKGGEEGGLSSPDNLAFDQKGNLWVTSDISASNLHRLFWESFGNNGLYMIETEGQNKGKVKQFASAPTGAEMTGIWFSPDEKTLFLSVQHPGEHGTDSFWPSGKPPKPSVIAIRRK